MSDQPEPPLRLAALRRLRFVAPALCVLAAASTFASERPGSLPPEASQAIARLVESAVAGRGRVEVKVGELDPRLQLAPCARAEPVVFPGTRLWGRSQITIRCVSGAQWSVLLPITVSVFGPALVARHPLAVGAMVGPGDFESATIDLTRENASYISDPALLAGKVMARPITAGQALRSDQLRIPPTVGQGDVVKVRVAGEGFVITTEAVALASAGPGQTVRLRTESGKVVSGSVREGFVEVRP